MSSTDPEAHPMLTAFARARTTRVQEAEQSVARSLSLHRVVDVNGELDLTHNAVRVGHVTLIYINYGAELTIHLQSPYQPYYLVQIPLSGTMRIVRNDAEVDATAGNAVITAPGHITNLLQYSENCARILVKIPPALIEQRQRVGAVGGAAPGSWQLPGVLEVDRGAGRTWLELLRAGIDDLDSGASMLSLPHAVSYFENVVIDGLLLVRQGADGDAGLSLTPSLRGALDFIDTHLAGPISVEDIAAATHMSVRALQNRFQRELGVTPISYVRNRRIEAVYRELHTSEAPTSVYAVAAKYGVTHLGRLAADYRDRFGETPSETIRTVQRRLAG